MTRAETDPAAAAELAEKRAYACEATIKSRQKMYEEAAERYDRRKEYQREYREKRKRDEECIAGAFSV